MEALERGTEVKRGLAKLPGSVFAGAGGEALAPGLFARARPDRGPPTPWRRLDMRAYRFNPEFSKEYHRTGLIGVDLQRNSYRGSACVFA